MRATTLAGWQLLLGGLPITVIAVLFERGLWNAVIHDISPEAVLATLLILAYPILFCWFAWFQIIKELPISVSAVSLMLVPVIRVYSGHLILGEPFAWRKIICLVFVCLALALVLLLTFNLIKIILKQN